MSSEPAAALHLVSRLGDEGAWRVCRSQAEGGRSVGVILLHDAVLETEASVARMLGGQAPPRLVVLACAADAQRRLVAERWALVEYPEIITSCAAAARVTSW